MPDRYGDPDPEPVVDSPRQAHETGTAADSAHQHRQRLAESRAAIANCGLCDDGLRGGFRCDHIDHAAAARRGMTLVREALQEGPRHA